MDRLRIVDLGGRPLDRSRWTIWYPIIFMLLAWGELYSRIHAGLPVIAGIRSYAYVMIPLFCAWVSSVTLHLVWKSLKEQHP